MKIRFERSKSLAAEWSRRLGLLALALFVFTAVLHRFGFLDEITFAATFALSGALALLALLLAIVGIYRLWSVGAIGGRAALKGLVMSLIVLIPTALVLYRGLTLPRLYDISTDTENPPRFLVPVSFEKGWHIAPFMDPDDPYSGQAGAYPRVTGRRYEGAVDRIHEAVRLVAENQGLRIVHTMIPPQQDGDPATADGNTELEENGEVDAEPERRAVEGSIIEFKTSDVVTDATLDSVLGPLDVGLLEKGVIGPTAEVIVQAEFRTLVWGMESDISIRLIEEIATTYVDMRSVSRFGPHDFGVNADIVSRFLTALDAELLGISVR